MALRTSAQPVAIIPQTAGGWRITDYFSGFAKRPTGLSRLTVTPFHGKLPLTASRGFARRLVFGVRIG